MKKILFFIIIISSVFGIFLILPIKETPSKTQWIFYDRTGEILFSEKPYFQSSTAKHKVSGEARECSLGQKIPDLFKKGLISIEDQDFYKHNGLDFSSIIRATKQNIKAQEVISGASTITMGLARVMFLETSKRNIWYKIRQTIYAIKLEVKFSKEEILEKYIKKINFGTGSTGLSSAANRYFSKTPNTLSIGETATLVGIIGNPSKFNPLTQSKNAEIRKNLILDIWEKRGIISNEEKIFWTNEPIKLQIEVKSPIHAPHFVFWVKNKIEPLLFDHLADTKEIHIHTTLDKQLYQKVLNITQHEIKRNKQKNNAHNAGVIAIDLNSNEIRVMLGSVNFFDKKIDGAVNMTTSKRSTGSVLKPFLYALALENGDSPADEIKDTLRSFAAGDGRYMPRNFNVEDEYGSVRYREALTNSYNLSAVTLLEKIGVKKFIKKLNEVDLDIGTEEHLGLASILGGGEENLLNLTNAYTVFSREGLYQKPKFIIDIKDENGISLLKRHHEALGGNIFSTSTSNWITHALSDESIRWKNFKRGNVLEVDRPAGAKTGTSQAFRDNWVIGFSPDFTVGVWVGNARGAPLHTSSGVEGAGTIWNKVFRLIHNDIPEKKFTYSSNRKEVAICRRPYEQDNCSERITEFLLPKELENMKITNNPKFSIAFPLNGDIFHKDSEILFKVRNTTQDSDIQYFLDNNQVSNHLKKIAPGKHIIWAKYNNNITDKIEFFVED